YRGDRGNWRDQPDRRHPAEDGRRQGRGCDDLPNPGRQLLKHDGRRSIRASPGQGQFPGRRSQGAAGHQEGTADTVLLAAGATGGWQIWPVVSAPDRSGEEIWLALARTRPVVSRIGLNVWRDRAELLAERD